ncbi:MULTISPECIES: GerAB/ArcD/ProY family transporter [Paenibacillus]|uniref:GerAB/ArcD/ProY family transporter n=1 Tax=Paenibacillus TaxID=44249 RepID=UPI0003E1BE6A|nr:MULTISPECIES: endospore germination permease [Paenibacillus]ETT36139.1 spore germination protein [Paenibacillus sp. FSL R5-192]ETT43801.1 spore germination protein [Paenibacillus sp. FSL H7-689]MCP1427034.1 spore germination protein (amino acid permease) [Paenibacillus xylanexedens]OMF42148.1 spore gernimation protein GerK [Paenibacillus amylolyticus]
MNKETTITRGQLFLLILKFEIGVDILSLPYRIHLLSKGGGWISVFLGGFLIQLVILLCWLLMRRFPSSSIYDIVTLITGKWIGKLLIIAYVGYFLLMGTSVLVNAYSVINRWMLQDTPRWAILALFLFSSIYLVRQKLRIIARVLVLISFLVLPMMVLISYGLKEVNLLYLLPLTEAGWPNIISGSTETLMAMFGFEFFLVVFPMVEGSSGGKLKSVALASAVVVVLYAFTVFICSTAFSPQQLDLMPEPVIYLLRSIPLGTMDRADFLFLPIWLISIFGAICGYYYTASYGISYLFKQKHHKKAVPYVVLASCIIAYLPQQKEKLELISTIANRSAYFFLMILPLLLLVLSYIMKRKEKMI